MIAELLPCLEAPPRERTGHLQTRLAQEHQRLEAVVREAVRATLEITSPAHKQVIDRIEANGRPSPAIRRAFAVDDAPKTTARLQDAGGEVLAAPVRTPWQSLNSRLAAPAGLQITLFQELLPAPERTTRPGFDTGH
ncbi:VOC family protein [Kocuria sp. KH4]